MLIISDRTEKLRIHALNGNYLYRSDESAYFYKKGLIECRCENETLRYGLAKEYEFRHNTPIIDDYELIVGKQNPRKLTEEETEENKKLDLACSGRFQYGGQESHMAIDFEKLLSKGLNGLLSEIGMYRSRLDISDPEDLEKDYFYRACEASLRGLSALSQKYSALAASMAEKENDPVRKAELEKIAETTAYVPDHPARSFYEACQSVSFVNSQLEGLYQLGRPDRYLFRFYENDMKNGTLTREKALELITCVSIMMNEYMPKGLAVGLMVGGRDRDGKDVTNDLTYLFIEAIALTRLSYPGVGLCADKDTPDDLMRLACEMIGKGYTHPAIFNDEVITDGLMQYGLPREYACEYTHSTCVEITPVKRSAVWVASPYHNLTQYLLDIMSSADADEKLPTFEVLLEAYHAHLAERIRASVIEQNRAMLQRMHSYANPLVSCFVDDCLARGKDIETGGALYNWIMPSFVGMSNLVDSLMTLKKLVYETGEYTVSGIYRILEKNFEDNEILRRRIKNTIEKYGNDLDEPDSLVPVINGYILEEVAKYRNPKDGRFIPSLFCWVMHESFGRETMATPDGRLANFPFGDGSGCAQGRDVSGPTASVISTTKWDHHPFIGGIALNVRFSKSMFNENSLPKLVSLVKTYLERGGFEIQINVVDKATMIEAQKNPEKYKDLIVRIGGYSDYFVLVGENMQNELIMRTENEL